MKLADFHIHTTFSDGKLTIPQIVDLYGKQGFSAIAITDHLCEDQSFLGRAAQHLNKTLTEATFPLYLEILKSEAERAWQQYKMLLISGVEITKNFLSNHRSAHILALGIAEYIKPQGDVLDVVKRIKNHGALAIAAHPVWTQKIEKQTFHLWDRKEQLRPYIDAWEVAAGQYLFPEVQESKLPKLASSDLHRIDQMSSWKTILNIKDLTREAVLNSIQKQTLDFHYYSQGGS